MTLIASFINKQGIVLASDSNLSNDKGNTGFGQKVFPIPYLNAGLAYTGVYTINNVEIHKWMTDFITGFPFAAIANTLEEFVINLTKELTGQIMADEAEHAIMIHACGYTKHEHRSYIEHWHISNARSIEADGSYGEISPEFHSGNDINSRTSIKDLNSLQVLDQSPMIYSLFINGFPHGRMAAKHIINTMFASLIQIWTVGNWKFREPQNLFEFATLIRMVFGVTGELFKMSDYNALYIGGETQTYLIPRPQDLAMPE